MYKPQDAYFHKAKREGYPARSVYKLEEIDRRHRLVRPGAKILELGASPGSWLKYCLNKIGQAGRIVAIDLEGPSLTLPPQVVFIKGDIFKIEVSEIKRAISSFEHIGNYSSYMRIRGCEAGLQRRCGVRGHNLMPLKGAAKQASKGGAETGSVATTRGGDSDGSKLRSEATNLLDLVLSDLAPHTSGIREVDQSRSLALASRAIEVAKNLLKEGGAILVKVFESGEIAGLKKDLASVFSQVKLERPQATRKGSREIYLLGVGFKNRRW